MAIAWRSPLGTNFTNLGSDNTPTVTIPSSVQAGDLILVNVGWKNTSAMTTPTGWNLADLVSTPTANNNSHALYYKFATGTEGGTNFSTTFVTATRWCAMCALYSGVAQVGNVVGTTGTNTASTTATIGPAITPVYNDSMRVAIPGIRGTANAAVSFTSTPTNWTLRGQVSSTSTSTPDIGCALYEIQLVGQAGTAQSAVTGTTNDSTVWASHSLTLRVAVAATFSSATSTSVVAGSALSFTVTASGTPNPTLTSSGTLPSGVTFVDNGSGTATLAGTPTVPGTYPLTFSAANNGGTTTQSFTLTVTQAPAITSASSTTATTGSALSFSVTSTGTPTPTLTKTGSLPTGVTFTDNGNGTATLAGTPGAATGGSYPITITATNSAGTATQSFTLTVNQAAAITSANSVTATVGSATSTTITTTGYPSVTLTKTGSLPSGVSFTDNGNGTATLAGTPTTSAGSPYVLTITASNGVGSNATQTFTLTVQQVPAFTSASALSTALDTPFNFTVISTGNPAATITKSGTLPTGVSFTNNGDGTATLSGTPSTDAGSPYALTFTAANGVGSNATQSFTLTITTTVSASTRRRRNARIRGGGARRIISP